VCLVLFAALLGFLPWNMPTARIFLGDVGSCFLGTTFGLLIVSSVTQGRIGLWTWLILFTHFIVDASLTLFLRMLRGEKWTQPHRKHLFQYILRLYEKRYKDEGLTEKKGRAKAHWHVNLWIQSGNLMIIFPAAWVAQQTPLYAPYICGSIMLLYGGILLRMDRYFQISQ
ncbi:hypothetical protein OAN22_02560, partial [Alphaproteobacteria bacterium]|nr:hypothetical protein [Alphaproteobacteria bacterium]